MPTNDTTDTTAQSLDLFTNVTSGWQIWDADLVAATRASTDALLAAVGIAPGMQVLDVASGTGEPALRIAILVGPAGKVTATDVMAPMLQTAEAKARRAGLSNITFQAANSGDLPFADGQFDAITCRMGAMFFPDRAFGELRRVLKRGGRIGFVVWGRFDHNPWLNTIRTPVLERSRVKPDPQAADPCRYGAPGALPAQLQACGFEDIQEEQRQLVWSFAGTPHRFWEFQAALGGSYSLPGWDSLSAEAQAQAIAESERLLAPYQVGEQLNIPVEVQVVTALG